MKLAYYIAVHHKPEQFRWLFDAIRSDEDAYAIHVDAKAPAAFGRAVREVVGATPRVTWLPRRHMVWGGWSQVAVELDAIGRLLAASRDWSYLVNLSGQCYPVRSREAIRAALAAQHPRSFIDVERFADKRVLQPKDPHLARRLHVSVFGRHVRTPWTLPYPPGLDVDYKGSQWHMLTREFCEWLVGAPIRSRIERFARLSRVPDEVFFQLMMVNGPFAGLRTADYGREIVWPGPRVLDWSDQARLAVSSALFARKFDAGVDRRILDWLAERGGYRAPGAPRVDR